MSDGTIILIIGLIFTLLKVLIIDIDPPHWDIANLQTLDEVYYVFTAYNLFETGSIFSDDKLSVFGNPWISNMITYFSLELFGDNYLGLRFSSIFFALVSVFFFWKILLRLQINGKVALFAILFLVCNFTFTLANIVIEPTIARTAGALISLYAIQVYWDCKTNSGLIILFIAFIIGFLWLFIYPTNAFLLVAFWLTILLKLILAEDGLNNVMRKLIKKAGFFALGLIGALALWSLFSYSLGENPLDFGTRGEHYSDRVGLSIKTILLNIGRTLKANIFVFNPFLIFLSVLSIGTILKKIFKRKNVGKIYPTLILVFSFLIQSLFINDFPQRKLIIMLPFLLFIITYYVDRLTSMKSKFSKRDFRITIVSLLFLFGSILTNLFVFNIRMHFVSLLSAFLLAIYYVFYLDRKSYNLNKWIPVIFLMFLTEGVFVFQYLIVNSTRYYEKMFLELSEYDGKTFVGGSSQGFGLYNDIKPKLNHYLYYGKFDIFWSKMDSLAKANKEVDYSIGYINDTLSFSNIGFYPIKILLKAEETVFIKDIVLYKEE